MAFEKKVWKDRVVEYPNRRVLNDGVVSKVVTVSRDEGNVTIAGDAFSAHNMTDLENRIESAFEDTPTYTAGENIDLTGGVINVVDVMTDEDAHDLWENT